MNLSIGLASYLAGTAVARERFKLRQLLPGKERREAERKVIEGYLFGE